MTFLEGRDIMIYIEERFRFCNIRGKYGMKLIVCLDEKKGMMFNGRRQSRDRLLIDDIEKQIGNAALYMTAYSEPLFLKNQIRYVISQEPMREAGDDDYCFVETFDPSPYADSVTEIILYHWNRHYPADLYFSMDMSHFQLIRTEEFAGSSHEKITKEVWRK